MGPKEPEVRAWFHSARGGHIDTALAALGKKRRIGLRMPYVVLSPMIVAESDLVLTTARWLADKLASSLGLVLRPPPAELMLAGRSTDGLA